MGWVGEAKPTPVTTLTLDTITLDNFKIAGIVVSTDGADQAVVARRGRPGARRSARRRCCDDGSGAARSGRRRGGGCLAGLDHLWRAAKFAASGTALSNVTADLALLFDELTSNGIPLAAPYFLMAPQVAVRLSLMNTAGAGFLNLGTRGSSTIATVPVLASTSVASDIIVLVDAAELIVCDTDEIELDLGRHASIQLNTTPDNPATAATVPTSLWQNNLAAWRVVRPINWTMRRAHAVSVLDRRCLLARCPMDDQKVAKVKPWRTKEFLEGPVRFKHIEAILDAVTDPLRERIRQLERACGFEPDRAAARRRRRSRRFLKTISTPNWRRSGSSSTSSTAMRCATRTFTNPGGRTSAEKRARTAADCGSRSGLPIQSPAPATGNW